MKQFSKGQMGVSGVIVTYSFSNVILQAVLRCRKPVIQRGFKQKLLGWQLNLWIHSQSLLLAEISRSFVHQFCGSFHCLRPISLYFTKLVFCPPISIQVEILQCEMKGRRVTIRERLLNEYQLGHSATEARQNICAAVGDEVIQRSTVFKCFKRFPKGNVETEDKRRIGRPISTALDRRA